MREGPFRSRVDGPARDRESDARRDAAPLGRHRSEVAALRARQSAPFESGTPPFGSETLPFGSETLPFGSGTPPFGSGSPPFGSGSPPFGSGSPPFGSGSPPFGSGSPEPVPKVRTRNT